MNMDHRINDVVILGGGTAGWMTASYLGKAFGESLRITVLEAPTVPRIGVGEATVPNLQRVLFDFLGLDEDEWMRECNASFKMAVKFVNWRTPGEGTPVARSDQFGSDHFYHPFGILPNHDHLPLSHYWFNRRFAGLSDESFAYSCFREPPLMDAKLSPRHSDGRAAARYAWHFDAQQVADFLCRFATEKQGAIHLRGEMQDAILDDRGYITALRLKTGELVEGDLFVDCSGFRGLLINKAMGEPFVDMSDHLLCDSAVATQVGQDDDEDGVEPYTTAIAMNAGWTWKIPLLGRFGTGYVYSSTFTSQDQATLEFSQMWGLDPERHRFNQIRFRVGRNRRSWVRNCVGIGLSSLFLEPLESTGIYFITAAIYQLAKHFPDKRFDQILIDRFNREIEIMFDDTRDFIQAHFSSSPRTDTPFWRATKELRLADDIEEKIAMYRAGLAVNMPAFDEATYYGNFDAEFRDFWTNGSYYCVLAGMGVLPDHPPAALAHRPASIVTAEPLFRAVKSEQQKLLRTLPTNADYLRQLHRSR
jgi:tryptophan 6-halogenase